MTDILVYSLFLVPLISSFIVYFLDKKSDKLRTIFSVFSTFISLLLSIFIVTDQNFSFAINYIGPFGLSFSVGGFNSVLLILTNFLWFISTIFSGEYFSHYKNKGRFFFFWFITLFATCGVFLSDNFFTTFFFFEIMSFASVIWVIHDENEVAFDASGTYLTVSLMSGLVMLMGIFLLYSEVGTLNFAELFDHISKNGVNSYIFISSLLMLVGFGAKAGMFPFHIWLPKAHPASPAPASALLSGILTKTGIFGVVAITSKLMFENIVWGKMLLFLAAITMTLGAVIALFSTNLKRTLACSSMSQIGFILVGVSMSVLLGEENQLALRGIILHIFNHSLIKLVLFSCAGVIYMNLHKLELNDIRGYGRNKPLLMIPFLLSALSIGGIPGFSGYISKTLLHESIVEYAAICEGNAFFAVKLVEYAFLFTGGLTLAYMTKLFVCIFVEKPNEEFKKSKYVSLPYAIIMLLISLIFPISGILPYCSLDNISKLSFELFPFHYHFHEVNYFSFVNISGAIISITIAIVIYFVFVRKFLISKEEGYKKYRGKKIDLENNLYKPILINFLPLVFGFVSSVFANNVVLRPLCSALVKVGAFLAHLFSSITDWVLLILRKTIFREIKEKQPHAVNSFSAYWGGKLFAFAKYHHPSEDQVIKNEIKFAKIFKTIDQSYRKITMNFSFALLMACIGICIIFGYLLFS